MLPATFNLPDAYKGDSYGPITISFFDSNMNPLDVTSAIVTCTVGTNGETRAREIVLKWPSDTHGVTLSANMVTLNRVPASEMMMSADNYFYDLQLEMADYTRTYLKGNLTVVDEVQYY